MRKHRLRRLPFLAAAGLCLAAGVWGGLVRLQWALPLPFHDASWITFHRPLMVAGFLGTVIGLERAVAANSLLAYVGPLLSAAAGIVLAAGGDELAGRVLAVLAAGSLAIVTALLGSRQPALHGAMVFAHAPIIFPAILHVPVPFRRRFYSHLMLLQLGVALRFVSDLIAWEPGKRWGGLLGAAAIALFVLNTVSSRLPRAPPGDQRSGGDGAAGRE